MRMQRRRVAGNTLIEFTLVGIPLVFLLVSVFEMSRGMWLYHTLATAVREGTRLAVVHGGDCNLYPNSCAVTVRTVANRIRDAAVGLPPSDMQNVTLGIESTCEKIRGLAATLSTVDAYQEIGDGFDGVVLKTARCHLAGCCAGCVVPSGIFKTVQVAGGVALPAPVSITIERKEM